MMGRNGGQNNEQSIIKRDKFFTALLFLRMLTLQICFSKFDLVNRVDAFQCSRVRNKEMRGVL
jgi:hypothetical protein